MFRRSIPLNNLKEEDHNPLQFLLILVYIYFFAYILWVAEYISFTLDFYIHA